jgi:chaperonin cofactor prefoldin
MESVEKQEKLIQEKINELRKEINSFSHRK